MLKKKPVLLMSMMIVGGGFLSSCGGAGAPTPEQTSICSTTTSAMEDNVAFCQPGQKIVYLPDSFGNEQLPIVFIGGNCDLRYTIGHSKGGVACIFLPIDRTQTVFAKTPQNDD